MGAPRGSDFLFAPLVAGGALTTSPRLQGGHVSASNLGLRTDDFEFSFERNVFPKVKDVGKVSTAATLPHCHAGAALPAGRSPFPRSFFFSSFFFDPQILSASCVSCPSWRPISRQFKPPAGRQAYLSIQNFGIRVDFDIVKATAFDTTGDGKLDSVHTRERTAHQCSLPCLLFSLPSTA